MNYQSIQPKILWFTVDANGNKTPLRGNPALTAQGARR